VTQTTAGGAQNTKWLVARTLTQIDGRGIVQPELAVSVPSVENGDWRINPDGTMEQTWTIRPNARWHDGQPVTADDFVMGWEIETHPALPTANSLVRAYVTSAQALDAQTLLLGFKATTPLAGEMLFDPLPRHILGESLQNLDADRFTGLDFWTTGFVGAGPYRLASWQPGASQEFAAFADYVGGKPKIDVLTFKFLADQNTLLANILAGEVDVALPDGISVETAGELKRGWAAPGTGNTVILFADGRLFRMEFQNRPEYAKPAAARDPRVRRAFYHSIDKQDVNEVELGGLGIIADSWIAADDPRRPAFQDAIPAWSYDVNLAQRELEDAGWRKGADGILVHGATGQRLETELRVTNGQGHVKALTVMANSWRQVGAQVTETVIPASLLTDQEYRSTFPFSGLTGHPLDLLWEHTHYACDRAARPETRWNGNRNGYCNPAIDPVIQRLQVTISEADRTVLQRQIMEVVLKEDLAQIPLYWQVTPIVYSKNVTGLTDLIPGPQGGAQAPWNVHLWERR
jgi:peptide/nickel transport system substrate-binding protein